MRRADVTYAAYLEQVVLHHVANDACKRVRLS